MARDLGSKHVCFNCGIKFYDLRKPEPICPKCGADQREASAKAPPATEKRRARPATTEPEKADEEVEVAADEELKEEDEDEEEDEEDDDED